MPWLVVDKKFIWQKKAIWKMDFPARKGTQDEITFSLQFMTFIGIVRRGEGGDDELFDYQDSLAV